MTFVTAVKNEGANGVEEFDKLESTSYEAKMRIVSDAMPSILHGL